MVKEWLKNVVGARLRLVVDLMFAMTNQSNYCSNIERLIEKENRLGEPLKAKVMQQVVELAFGNVSSTFRLQH